MAIHAPDVVLATADEIGAVEAQIDCRARPAVASGLVKTIESDLPFLNLLRGRGGDRTVQIYFFMMYFDGGRTLTKPAGFSPALTFLPRSSHWLRVFILAKKDPPGPMLVQVRDILHNHGTVGSVSLYFVMPRCPMGLCPKHLFLYSSVRRKINENGNYFSGHVLIIPKSSVDYKCFRDDFGHGLGSPSTYLKSHRHLAFGPNTLTIRRLSIRITMAQSAS